MPSIEGGGLEKNLYIISNFLAKKINNISLITVSKNENGQIDLPEAMKILADKGLTRVLVEGGGLTVTSFLKESIFDRVLWFHNASILGSDAHNAFQDMGVTHLDKKIKLSHIDRRIFGEDMLDIYEKA